MFSLDSSKSYFNRTIIVNTCIDKFRYKKILERKCGKQNNEIIELLQKAR